MNMEKSERLSRTASVAYTKGLLNNPGENNCFLNSAVQVLWHLDVFRRSFREISGHYCVGESCIFCALKVIFTQFQYSDESALPPDALRQALAVTYKDQQRFQLQDMDDAAECLENILNRLHFHFAMNERDEICNAAHCISHRKFAMEIMEQSICNCGATSEPLPFSQLVHYVSVTALCNEADFLASKLKGLNQDMFGQLLKRAVNQGDVRTCPGINCGKKISVQQSLLNCPDVVCIGLSWDSECPEMTQITQLLDCIDPVLRLPEVFPRVVDDTARKVELLLAGVVTYYGKHYSTFFYSNKLMTWIYFDDARVRKCGSEWETIRKKCCQNHYQPLLLLYVNPHGRAVNTRYALPEVKVVDTKTLLASQENNRTARTSYSNEKTNEHGVSTLSVVHEHKPGGDTVDGLLSSSSSHSIGSDRGSERDAEVSAPDRKKSKRSMKKLRGLGSDIKRALSRSRNSSPTSELSKSTGSIPEKNENVNETKKQNSTDDLINFSDEPKPKATRAYNSSTTRVRDVEDPDSGLGSGSSEASSPATSSVSSVDTTTDDLIDFTSRTFPRPTKANDIQLKLDNIVEDGESLLRRSYELEKGDLTLSLSLATNAATRFRIAVESYPAHLNQASLAKLKEKHAQCLDRSRHLHRLINEKNNNTTSLQFSLQEKQKLINRQKERDQQVLREMKQTPTIQGTLTRSPVKHRVRVDEVVPMTSRSINDLYVNNHTKRQDASSPVITRRSSSRISHVGTVGRSRNSDDFYDDVNCTQKIKPDVLCYSPVHYGKTNGLSNDFERMSFAQESRDRNTSVTHISTSFIPVQSLPVDQMLATSTVLPNSRGSRNTDIRRCSIYDNMPHNGDPKLNSNVPQRTVLSSSHPNNRSHSSAGDVGDNRRSSWGRPVYVEPPPYNTTRAAQYTSKSQSGGLLQRFNVPVTSRYSETAGLPDDVRQAHEGIRNSRRLCGKCKGTFVEKNAMLCLPCLQVDTLLYNLADNTAMQY